MSNASPSKSGMIMGPDGKPCKSCTAFRNWNPTGAVQKVKKPDQPPANCPPDVEQLGRSTWTFCIPLPPNMLMLLRAIPLLYACNHCADDFGKDIDVHPPDVSSRSALSRWLCERHNAVNEKLGKTPFDCSLKSTDERWKDGPADGSCE
ncbi:ERV/ALR sulfhydryl oxidase domain-containing protein [Mucidula mucida]|nr:ERV/ALR sulfhydryl oxidase domain-containing protein [Mucidula mucida]